MYAPKELQHSAQVSTLGLKELSLGNPPGRRDILKGRQTASVSHQLDYCLVRGCGQDTGWEPMLILCYVSNVRDMTLLGEAKQQTPVRTEPYPTPWPFSINCRIAWAGIAPACRATSRPDLSKANAGIELT
jgi:hypothetical protein